MPLSETRRRVPMPKTVDQRTIRRSWVAELDALNERIAPRFSRAELRRRTRAYLRGLLGAIERKNSWQLAEAAGDETPYGLQHLLGRADWDADLVRDDLRDYVVEHLGDDDEEEEEEGAVLVVDETGFLKKGTESVGVKRQYTGTAGKKRENCQVGVFLCYATKKGAAFIDRELYLPEEWAQDAQRREKAGVPNEVAFATKPQLAHCMLKRAHAAGVRAAWVVADCGAYGDARYLGVWLEEKEQPYVLGVSGKAHVWRGFYQPKVSEILDTLRNQGELPREDEGGGGGGEEEEEGWRRLSAGSGAKGERLYDWIRLPLNPPLQEGFSRWLLVGRPIIGEPDELAA
jgi:SRSO17 transposase